jgi:hypothetical protein
MAAKAHRKIDQPPIHHEMSIQAQLEANDTPEYANEPGPGHYFGPENNGFSSIGKQHFSKSASAPEFEFARTGWQEWKKVIISKGHEGAYKLRDSPGAVYELPDTSMSKMGTVVGTGQRPDLSRSLGMNPDGSPGPKYNLRDTKPREVKIAREQMNSKTDRFSTGHKFQGPGPYSRKDVAMNPGTGRSFGIGRAAYEKVIRPGWEQDGQCKVSSKIGEGKVWTDIVQDPASNAYTIGNAPRFPKDRVATAVPGPGQYKRDERDVSRCSSVCSDTRTPTGAPFGRRLPRKPRFRQVLAMTTASRGGWGYF